MVKILLAFFVVSLGLGRWLIVHDRGPREPARGILLATSVGLLSALIAAVVENYFLPNLQVANQLPFPSALLIGVIEEILKFLPLTWLLYKKPYFNECTDGLIYFGIAGLAFGFLENVAYTLTYGPATGIARLILVPFFHAATCGLVGLALARHKLGLISATRVVQTLLFICLVHGSYDYLISAGNLLDFALGALLTFAVTAFFFKAYGQAVEQDRQLGLQRTVL